MSLGYSISNTLTWFSSGQKHYIFKAVFINYDFFKTIFPGYFSDGIIFNFANTIVHKNYCFMRLHFIAIGGSAMHNLAIALKQKGYTITGSDDEIFEPSKSRLQKYGILPSKMGWDKNNIKENMDAVILGMHAKQDNPELIAAKKKGIKIFSYPEFLYEQSKNKTRIVIGGSHGKTTITAMILHALHYNNIKTDYMVGAQLKGFDVMVKLTGDAPFIVLEGDEYLSSPIDKRPKFHLYNPHIALLSGIAWDHVNVFPTFEKYLEQFRIFIDKIEPDGKLIYNKSDKVLRKLVEENTRESVFNYSYKLPDYEIIDGKTIIKKGKKRFVMKVFGKHNLNNLLGAMTVCNQLGLTKNMFFEAMESFEGAGNRLEELSNNGQTIVFKDFAHAPSKLNATIDAVREQFPDKKIIACMELHTYSSLSDGFLEEYKGSMDHAHIAIVFYNPEAVKLKRLPEISAERIISAFGNDHIEVYNNSAVFQERLLSIAANNACVLLMSSGNFGNLNLQEIALSITHSTNKTL